MTLIIKVALSSFFSLVFMFLITKLIGKKQIAQMSIFEYVNGITLGSIGAELATTAFEDWVAPVVALIVYGVVVFLISVITRKSLILRRLLDGKAMILYEDGKFYKENLKKANLDINAFLVELRVLGYFNIADVQTAIHEPNGKVSVLPKAYCRPAKTSELNVFPSEEKPAISVIIDGAFVERNMKFAAVTKQQLLKEIKKQKIKDLKDIFYATADCNGNFSFYTQLKEKPDSDIFM